MALQDPIAVYTAANNMEAAFLRDVLQNAGIEAFAVEDVSQAGTWILGSLPQIHKPQVWVDLCNVDRANALIEEYENRAGERRGAEDSECFCYQCGEAVQRGAAACPACGKELDWSESSDDSHDSEGTVEGRGIAPANDGSPSSFDSLNALKRPVAWIMLSPWLLLPILAVLAILGSIVRILIK